MVQSSLAHVSLHDHVNLLALRPERDNDAGLEEIFMSGTLQYSYVGYLPSCAIPHSPTNLMSIVIKCMTLIPVVQDSVHRRVNFAAGFVTGRTFTGLLQERITCVGQCFPYFKGLL